MHGIGLILLVFVLLVLRQNLFVLLTAVTVYAYLAFGLGDISNIVVDAWDAANKEILLAIPLYILAGNLMAEGAMAQRLVRFMRALTAPVPGGLAIATIFSCAAFAAVTGSGSVTLLAVGGVMYPALIKDGYSKSFALGALCAGGTLGIIVPPSIPLILYGVMTQTSIAELFVAGIGPSVLLITLMSAYAIGRNLARRGERWSLAELRQSFTDGIWALAMPVIILGGIYSGYFTATESAAVATVYAIAVETLIHRELDLAGFQNVLVRTAALLGALFPVLMIALSLNTLLTFEQVPEQLVGWFESRIDSRTGFLLGVNLFLLLIGCVMDIGSAILILAPMLYPLAVAQGIDPVHFGIVMVMNLEIGYLTPPLGLNLIVAMTAFGVDFRTICRAVLPFLAIILCGLLVVSFWPAISLFPLK